MPLTKKERLAGLSRDELEELSAAARVVAAALREQEPEEQKADAGDFKDSDPNDRWCIEAAQEQYNKDGEIEVDDSAILSRGAVEGAYVQAWVFVYFPQCETCGTRPCTCDVTTDRSA